MCEVRPRHNFQEMVISSHLKAGPRVASALCVAMLNGPQHQGDPPVPTLPPTLGILGFCVALPRLLHVSSRARTLVLGLAKLALRSLSLVQAFAAVANAVTQTDLRSAVLLRPSLTTVGLTGTNLHAWSSSLSSLSPFLSF